LTLSLCPSSGAVKQTNPEKVAMSEQLLRKGREQMEKRIAKIRALIHAKNLTGVLLFGTPQTQGAVQYASENHSIIFGSAFVYISKNSAVFLVHGLPEQIYALSHSYIKDVRLAPTNSSLVDIVSQLLEKDGSSHRYLGIVNYELLPVNLYRELSKISELVDVSEGFIQLLFEKDALGIEAARRSAQVADSCLKRVVSSAKVGMTGNQVLAIIQCEMQTRSCTNSFNMASVGKIPNMMFTQCTDKIEKGSTITLEITPRLGLWTQLNRPFSVGKPDPSVCELFEGAKEIQEAGVNAAKIGKKSGDVAQIMVDKTKELGYTPISPADMGHLIGYEIVENWIRPDSSFRFTKGMTMVLHAIIDDKKAGFMIYGDTYLIRNDGPERLTKSSKKFFIKEA
jgi:Xaa-Pro aminopeptidase